MTWSPPWRLWRFPLADIRVETAGLSRFFRSLSTMMAAGIPVHMALAHLGENNKDDPGVASVAEGLSKDILRGVPLSHALRRYQNIFDTFSLTMVKVGESTGSLDKTLSAVADHWEWIWKNRQKLKSTLTYPAFSLLFCLAMAIVGPAYILRGQLEMLRNSHVELPLITKALITFSDLFHSSAFVASLILGAFCLLYLVKVEWRKAHRRDMVQTFFTKIPGLAELLRLNALSRFTRALGLLLQTGVTITDALPLACASSGDPILIRDGRPAVERLVAGATMAETLSEMSYCDNLLTLSLEAGEQTGTVAATMKWISDLYAAELESRFERLTALLEPCLMLFTGLCVGSLLIATLLPTVKMLETL